MDFLCINIQIRLNKLKNIHHLQLCYCHHMSHLIELIHLHKLKCILNRQTNTQIQTKYCNYRYIHLLYQYYHHHKSNYQVSGRLRI